MGLICFEALEIGKSRVAPKFACRPSPWPVAALQAAAVVDQLGAFRTFGSALCIAAMSELGGERIQYL